MIEKEFTEAHSSEWVKTNIADLTNELVILRKIIPWEKIVKQLSKFYKPSKGRIGKSTRVLVALLILSKLRILSDAKVVEQVKENRYYQHFCNVPDEGLATFINSSSLCRTRQRFGKQGMVVIEKNVFNVLRRAGVIDPKYALIDSSVLESNIVYPTDVKLVYKAFCKMSIFAKNHNIAVWWEHDEIKAIWREFSLNKEANALSYLAILSGELDDNLDTFEVYIELSQISEIKKEKAQNLLALLRVLNEQNKLKIQGQTSIDNRIVSLDELEARPIKKGKKHPKCEFGTTFQATFNRQGFMVTIENFIGKPNDKTLYPEALELFNKRMKTYPEIGVLDLGYRSQSNFMFSQGKVKNVFLGRSTDVDESKREACQKARSATEGFIAVVKNWRGFGRSLYRGFKGDKVWSLLCQTAHNLKKFLQLYRAEKLEEKSLVKLGLLGY